MLKIKNDKVMNFEGALRGMRNPMESWGKSNSFFVDNNDNCIQLLGLSQEEYQTCLDKDYHLVVGDSDFDLAKKLATAGSDHAKFMRQIFVCVDITAPLYWWKEFDTYKVGTVANSTSTMHKLGSRGLVAEDFSWDTGDKDDEDIEDSSDEATVASEREMTLGWLNRRIKLWKTITGQVKDTNDRNTQRILRQRAKRVWRRLIQDLPSSFNQTRTVTLNYENLRNIYFARKNHKLSEWHSLCFWITGLPFSQLITEPRKSPREIHLEELVKSLSTDISNAFVATEGVNEANAVKVLCNVQAILAIAKNRLETPDPTAN